MQPLEFGFNVGGWSVRLQVATPVAAEPPAIMAETVEAGPALPPAKKQRVNGLRRGGGGRGKRTVIPVSEPEPESAKGRPLSVAECIRQVVADASRTNAEVFDHVQRRVPGTARETVNTVLSQLRAKNQIAKRDDLKWYPVGARA